MATTTRRIRVQVSPSRMVAHVRAGRLRFELFTHGGATRVVPDGSLCGYCGTHYTRVARGTWEEMAAAAVASWRTDRAAWSPCE